MRFLLRLLAVIGLLSIVFVGLVIVAISRIHIPGRPVAPIADNSVLTLTVEGPFTEELPIEPGLPAALQTHAHKLRDVIAGIDRGAADGRIKGLVLKIDASAGAAQDQELRGAIRRFRDAGKPVYAFAENFGEEAPGDGAYWLAAACNQIWLQPMGEVTLTELRAEQPFIKDALAKLGIDPEFMKRAEYKTAPDLFTEKGYTPPAREMMESLVNDLTLQLVADVATGRGLPPEQVHAILTHGPLSADDAAAAKLIDHVGYADELVEAARKAAGDKAKTLPLIDYAGQTAPARADAPNVAIIYQVGEIGAIEGPIDPRNGERSLKSENGVMRGFAAAIDDPGIKSIVFRIDSPGGSVSGSEAIRHMAVQAKKAGKKLVVSMGATAASGGYWIAADADKIVADPGTLTGSIGVFSGKFVVTKGLGDLGVTFDSTQAGPFAALNSPFTAYTPEQSQRLNTLLDQIYGGFVARVAEGRKLPPATVAQSAKGRVWTGQQAKQLGLVDELGGLSDAIRVARDLAGIGADQVRLTVLPKPLSPLETLQQVLNGNVRSDDALLDFEQTSEGPAGTVVRALAPLFRSPADTRLRMPDPGIRD